MARSFQFTQFPTEEYQLENDAMQLSAIIVIMSENGKRTLNARAVEFQVEFAEDIPAKVGAIPLEAGEVIRYVRTHFNNKVIWDPETGLRPPHTGRWQTREEFHPPRFSAAAVAIRAQRTIMSVLTLEAITTTHTQSALKCVLMPFPKPITRSHALYHAKRKAAELFPSTEGWTGHIVDIECFDPIAFTEQFTS